MTYAGKAFLYTALARLMSAERVGLDVASAGEIYIARHGGADPAGMQLHGNNKSRRDLAYALEAGVGRIVVDNEAELERLADLAAERGQTVAVWLRVTPDVAVETHHQYTVTGTADSKFGLALAEAKAVAERLLGSAGPSLLRLTGLHLHLGSHFHEAGPVGRATAGFSPSLHKKYSWTPAELCPGGG